MILASGAYSRAADPVEAPAEEEEEGGARQEERPCVIAPLRPLSNDGQTNHIPVGWGTRAPGGLGMRVGVQSNPSLTMSPQGRGIRRGGHHLPGCFSDIARVPNTRIVTNT
eukprot:COSAG01_NODE_283_length_19477_cov_44.267468_21_plen_111_part_00